MRRATILSCLLAVALAGCGSSATTSGPSGVTPTSTAAPLIVAPSTTAVPSMPSVVPTALGLAGQWSGTWQNTTPDRSGGTFALTWTQTGSNLSGTITIKGTPCLTGGTVTGTVTGSTISFGAVSGQVEVAYDGSIAGNKMAGTYATGCGNAKGTWEATKN